MQLNARLFFTDIVLIAETNETLKLCCYREAGNPSLKSHKNQQSFSIEQLSVCNYKMGLSGMHKRDNELIGHLSRSLQTGYKDNVHPNVYLKSDKIRIHTFMPFIYYL